MVHNNKSQKKRKQIANNEPDFNSNIEKGSSAAWRVLTNKVTRIIRKREYKRWNWRS